MTKAHADHVAVAVRRRGDPIGDVRAGRHEGDLRDEERAVEPHRGDPEAVVRVAAGKSSRMRAVSDRVRGRRTRSEGRTAGDPPGYVRGPAVDAGVDHRDLGPGAA